MLHCYTRSLNFLAQSNTSPDPFHTRGEQHSNPDFAADRFDRCLLRLMFELKLAQVTGRRLLVEPIIPATTRPRWLLPSLPRPS